MSKALQSTAARRNGGVGLDCVPGCLHPHGRPGRQRTARCGRGHGELRRGGRAWERFHKRPQPDGSVAFESAAFPNVYLRMDGQDVDILGTAAGIGAVNCQFGVGAWERFVEHDPPFPAGHLAGG
jgi:hypothetical protein